MSRTRDYLSIALLAGARAGVFRMGAALRVSIVELGGGGFPPDDVGGTVPAPSIGVLVQSFL